MSSLRERINQNCRDCVVDGLAPGNWRQQVTLCSVKSCALHEIRPKTTQPIPESVLRWYGVNSGEFQGINGTLGVKQ